MILFFAYDALILPENMKKICPRAKVYKNYTLPGHRIVFREEITIEQDSTDCQVSGVLWQITKKDMLSLAQWYDIESFESQSDTFGIYNYTFLEIEGKQVLSVYVDASIDYTMPEISHLDDLWYAYDAKEFETGSLSLATEATLILHQQRYIPYTNIIQKLGFGAGPSFGYSH